jgi:hypothetical protein
VGYWDRVKECVRKRECRGVKEGGWEREGGREGVRIIK